MNLQRYLEIIDGEELMRRQNIYKEEVKKASLGLASKNSIPKQIFGRDCELLEVKKISEDEAVMYKNNPYSQISPFEQKPGHEFFISCGQGITNLTDFNNVHNPSGRTDVPIPVGYKTLYICERLYIFENGEIIYENPEKSNYNFLAGNDKMSGVSYSVFSLSDNLYYYYRFGSRGNTYKRKVDTCATNFEEYMETASYFSERYGVRTILAMVVESCNWH